MCIERASHSGKVASSDLLLYTYSAVLYTYCDMEMLAIFIFSRVRQLLDSGATIISSLALVVFCPWLLPEHFLCCCCRDNGDLGT